MIREFSFFFACVSLVAVNATASELQEDDPAKSVAYLQQLLESYPDQIVAAQMSMLLTINLESGNYGALQTRQALAKALTTDVRLVERDFHLGVMFAPTSPTEDAAHHLDNVETLERLRKTNFGFEEARILQGNVGYLRISALHDISVAVPAAKHALGFVQHVDALIIDIRGNLGGEPNMVRLIQSVFFEKPTHLNTLHYTDGREQSTEEIWTDPALVDIDTLVHTPIYVLISEQVASAAESFAYALQTQKRATLVGGRTLGAAHPGESHYREDLQLNFSVPNGYAVNPISGKDWEGVGVIPDIESSDATALDTALERAWMDIGYSQESSQ